MIRMTISDMLAATGASLVAGSDEASFCGVCMDSRDVKEGSAFVAFKGERTDGNRFVAQAIASGATVAVLTAEPTDETLVAARNEGVCLVRAADDDGESFMLALARAWRERNPQWLVVGVTGSVGKTTTKEMLAAGIGTQRRVHATKGNFNSLLGVPLTLFAASADDEVLVVEMGMNNAGELDRIAQAAQPQVAVITNVGTSHIGNLGSRANIARAKAEVVGHLTAANGVEPTLVLTATDDYADFIQKSYCEPNSIRVLRVGAQDADVAAYDVKLDEDGLPSFGMRVVGDDMPQVALPLPGRAMVADAQSAMGAVSALGLDCTKALAGICTMRPTHMRLEVRQEEGTARVIDDSYNASPSSMAAALDVLCSMRCEGRRIAVLGEIGELGDEAERLHELVGAYAAAKPLDMLVLIGTDLASHMAEAARTMGFSEDHMELFASVEDALRVVAPLFSTNDLVLVKASRAAGLDRFSKEVLGA